MPELPEVESLRQSLLPHLVGRRVVSARLLRRDILVAPGDPPGGFSRQRGRAGSGNRPPRPRPISPADLLAGTAIIGISRHGKQLAILSSSGRALVVQLGMTGHLEISAADDAVRPHVHALWSLDNARTLIFEDARRFGTLRLFRSRGALDAHWSALGPDALGITADQLHAALSASDRPIKAALLDQSALAGVGNIYADEALFASRIHPARRACRLSAPEVARLAAHIHSVLASAITAGGSTLRDYADANGRAGSYQAQHAVYGRSGEPCPACSHTLRSATLAQRTTVWCPRCQPASHHVSARLSVKVRAVLSTGHPEPRILRAVRVRART